MAGSLRITWLGHATEVVDLDGVRVLTDPLLGRHPGLLRRRGTAPDPAVWQGADAVVISHLHYDHAELRSLRRLTGIPVLTAPENAHWLRDHGIADAIGLSMGDWFPVGPDGQVQVRLTPAVHAARPMPHRANAANGHLITGAGRTVWAVGDTQLFPDIERVPDMAPSRIDVALVPISGWGPRLSPGHLDPAGAAQVCRIVDARFAIPVHWGTLHPPATRHVPTGWMDRPGPLFADEILRRAPHCQAVVLKPGESWTLPTG